MPSHTEPQRLLGTVIIVYRHIHNHFCYHVYLAFLSGLLPFLLGSFGPQAFHPGPLVLLYERTTSVLVGGRGLWFIYNEADVWPTVGFLTCASFTCEGIGRPPSTPPHTQLITNHNMGGPGMLPGPWDAPNEKRRSFQGSIVVLDWETRDINTRWTCSQVAPIIQWPAVKSWLIWFSNRSLDAITANPFCRLGVLLVLLLPHFTHQTTDAQRS